MTTPVPAAVGTEPVSPLRALVDENADALRQLRSQHIPQQIGMAAACRSLALELPRTFAQQLEADVASGRLSERWAAATSAAQAEVSDVDPSLAAAALLLREQSRVLVGWLVARGKQWMAEAYRLEGQADALEAQISKLARLAGPVADATVDPVPTDGAREGSDVTTPEA